MRTIEFTIPVLTPSNNELLRMHWTQRRKLKKDLAKKVFLALIERGTRCPAEPLAHAYIEIERFSSGELDDDNFQGGAKLLLDVLQRPSHTNPHGLSLIHDDNNQCVLRRRMTQSKAKRGKGYTRVLIAEILE